VSGEFRVGTTDDVSVRFVDSEDGALSVLEIENPRDHQVFGEVRNTLRAAGVEVVSFEVRVEQDVLRGRLRLTDSGGAPLDQQRHLEIQDRVLNVALARTAPTSDPRPAKAAG
jgi:hypothetical protein